MFPSHSNCISDESSIRSDLEKLSSAGYSSLAVVLAHSYTFPDHELFIGSIAESLGFTQISLSSQLLPMIKMVPRGVSSTADAYLTPILRSYLNGFFDGFDEQLRSGGLNTPRVEFMASDGGLLDLDNFSGLKSILSGPAGGVVGYALTSWDETEKAPIIGYDHESQALSKVVNSLCSGWTSEELRPTSRDTTADTKRYMRLLLPVLQSKAHS